MGSTYGELQWGGSRPGADGPGPGPRPEPGARNANPPWLGKSTSSSELLWADPHGGQAVAAGGRRSPGGGGLGVTGGRSRDRDGAGGGPGAGPGPGDVHGLADVKFMGWGEQRRTYAHLHHSRRKIQTSHSYSRRSFNVIERDSLSLRQHSTATTTTTRGGRGAGGDGGAAAAAGLSVQGQKRVGSAKGRRERVHASVDRGPYRLDPSEFPGDGRAKADFWPDVNAAEGGRLKAPDHLGPKPSPRSRVRTAPSSTLKLLGDFPDDRDSKEGRGQERPPKLSIQVPVLFGDEGAETESDDDAAAAAGGGGLAEEGPPLAKRPPAAEELNLNLGSVSLSDYMAQLVPPAPAGRSPTPLSEYSRGSQIAHLNDEDCRPPHAADPEVDIDMELNISVGLESDPSSELLDSIPTAEVSLADEYDDGEASSDLGLGDDGRAAAGSWGSSSGVSAAMASAHVNDLDLRPGTDHGRGSSAGSARKLSLGLDDDVQAALGIEVDAVTRETDLSSLSAELFSPRKKAASRVPSSRASGGGGDGANAAARHGEAERKANERDLYMAAMVRDRKPQSARAVLDGFHQRGRDFDWDDVPRPPSRQRPPPEALHLFADGIPTGAILAARGRQRPATSSATTRPRSSGGGRARRAVAGNGTSVGSSRGQGPMDRDALIAMLNRPPTRQRPPPESLGLGNRSKPLLNPYTGSDSEDDANF